MPWKRFTFNEIKKYSAKKSKSYLEVVLNKFAKEDVITKEKVGNIIVYRLNINSQKALNYTGFIAEYITWHSKWIPLSDLNEFISKVPTRLFITLITGSYAGNKQTEKSDIDVIIICDNALETKKIYAELDNAASLNIPNIHLYVFKEKEFLEMLHDKSENYGKEAARNNLIFNGGQEYYSILAEAIQNGFNG